MNLKLVINIYHVLSVEKILKDKQHSIHINYQEVVRNMNKSQQLIQFVQKMILLNGGD